MEFKNDLAESLESLVSHPGWAAFVKHVQSEWGPSGVSYDRAMDNALDISDGAVALSRARQIRESRRMIDVLLSWPKEEVARLRKGMTIGRQPGWGHRPLSGSFNLNERDSVKA